MTEVKHMLVASQILKKVNSGNNIKSNFLMKNTIKQYVIPVNQKCDLMI